MQLAIRCPPRRRHRIQGPSGGRFGKDSGRCTVVCHAHCVTDVTHDIVSTITNFLETIGASLCAADLAELKSKIEG